MESTIKEHPLWAHAPDEEIDSAIKGPETYVMTKLFNHALGSSPEHCSRSRDFMENLLAAALYLA